MTLDTYLIVKLFLTLILTLGLWYTYTSKYTPEQQTCSTLMLPIITWMFLVWVLNEFVDFIQWVITAISPDPPDPDFPRYPECDNNNDQCGEGECCCPPAERDGSESTRWGHCCKIKKDDSGANICDCTEQGGCATNPNPHENHEQGIFEIPDKRAGLKKREGVVYHYG